MRGEYEELTEEVEDPQAQIERLTLENQRLRKQIRQLKAAAKLNKKVEFSKLIFVGVSVVTVAIVLFSCRMIWITMDTSALGYLIPAVFTEMAAATGFYYSKAKAENKIKLMAAAGVQPEAANFNDM
nr:MAG TPA: Herpesvirus BLRF2 protein [Caudoviricetes sp.]